MRKPSRFVALAAALQFVILSTPVLAQQPAPAPARPVVAQPSAAPVQPVPYATSQPIPYSPTPPPTALAPQAAPGPVYATSPGSDIVVLKNGGMIRGTLVELLPNDHATVQLPSGQSALIQWSEIHHIERGAPAPPVGTPMPTVVAPPPKPPPTMSGPTVLVHVESSHKVLLDRRNPGDGEWLIACESPCDVQLPLNNDYRIVGTSVTGSSEFNLEGSPGQRVVINVNAGTKLGLTAGLGTAAVGLLVVITGLYVVAGATAVNAANCTSFSTTTTSSTCKNNDSSSGTTTGLVVMGLGLVAIGVGGVIAIINWRTGQSQEVQSPRQGTVINDAWKRAATWRETNVLDNGPQTTSTPIFRMAF